MHIPDSFLDGKTIAVTTGLAVAGLGLALHRTKRDLPPQRMPLLGLSAAFVFAAQMLNFPVLGGTSGHLIGGTLVAILLGPSAAVVVLACVLIVQALLFADGGVTVLGANIVNMALVGGVGGYAGFRLITALIPGRTGYFTGAAFGAWMSTILAALCCAGELAASGKAPWGVALTAMGSVHVLIGLGEAAITVLVLGAIRNTRPELTAAAPAQTGYGTAIAFGLLVSLALALFVAPFKCAWDDGLEHVAKTKLQLQEGPAALKAPMADYKISVLPEAVTTSVAGGVGTLVVFVGALAMARLLGRGRNAKCEMRNAR